MIEATVDDHEVDPATLQMHQQDEPFPGGRRYLLRITDSELVAVVSIDFPQTQQQLLESKQTASLFNILRPYISMKVGRNTPRFWANTVDNVKIIGDALEIAGTCSPHV